MSRILLIETATEVCSAAIAIDGHVVAVSEDLESQNHASILTLQLADCAKAADMALVQMDAVAISLGPGSYSSLRVGASVAKGICYALDKPLIAVDTLLALAVASRELNKGHFYLPMLDARRQEVWTAVFDAECRQIALPQPLILENKLLENFLLEKTGAKSADGLVLSGNGMKKVTAGSFFENAVFSEVKKCSARHLASIAEKQYKSRDFCDVAYFEPFYLKPPNITVPKPAID